MVSLRCHGDFNCNKTQIIRNFHLYMIQLWKPFFHIFTFGRNNWNMLIIGLQDVTLNYPSWIITSQKLLQRVAVMLEYIINFFTRLLAYSGDLTEGPFWCKFYLFAKCARAYETWKQCQWIMWTLTCKHKIWGKNWLYLRPYLKAFPVFNVLETRRVYLLTIDLRIFEFIKKIIKRFFEKCEICKRGPNYVQNCNKSSWMQYFENALIEFVQTLP